MTVVKCENHYATIIFIVILQFRMLLTIPDAFFVIIIIKRRSMNMFRCDASEICSHFKISLALFMEWENTEQELKIFGILVFCCTTSSLHASVNTLT